jgi:hypothetical protein
VSERVRVREEGREGGRKGEREGESARVSVSSCVCLRFHTCSSGSLTLDVNLATSILPFIVELKLPNCSSVCVAKPGELLQKKKNIE